MKKILMIFLAVFFVLAVEKESFAQEEKVLFSVSSDFPKQVESYMGIKTTLNKELKAEVKKFTEKLEKNVISGEYVEQIVNLMNSYADKRANPTTHMLTVIKIFNAFWEKNQTGQFKVWHDYIMHLIGRNVPLIRLNEVMNFTVNLLLYNSLEYAASKNWYLSSSSYVLRVTPDYYGSAEDLLTVECQNTDIRCRMKNDTSLVIYSTSGVYTPSTHEWKGKNGKVDFRRGNLSPDSIYAELPEYVIDTRSPQYSVENVMFYNRKYFQKGLKGHFEDKVVLNGTGEKARYPQFKSYATDIKIENLAEGIDYVGGYAQNGVIFSGMVSDSLGTSYSQIVFKRDGKPFITASSRAFVFGLDKLESQKAKIEINNGQDGVRITHIGLKLKYNSKTQQLILFRGTNESEVAEFVDDYHNLYIDANQLEWKLNDTVIYFATRPAAPNNYATFKSKDYFSHAEWNEFQGPENTNWLVILRNLFYGDARSQYTSREIQQYVNTKYKLILTEVQVHQVLLKLAYKDFLEYDISERTLYNFTQKFWDWINSHNRKSDSLKAVIRKNPNFDPNIHGEDKDYDNIIINSKPKPKSKKDEKGKNQDKTQNDELMELIENTQSVVKNYVNGIINLNNNDLFIYHVRPFDLSKSRMVKIISDSVVIVHKNCDMTFNGKIQAGLVDFYGRDFQFNYDSFNIKIPKADSMSVLTVGKTPDGKHRKIDSVRSVFETIVGVLQIDAFNNKSGVNENNVYPSLTTTDTSYVYYDKLTSEKYDRDKFHMIVYPFKLDSMNFIELNGVKAKGKFVSGIFPDLDVTLNVQPDLSLGFVLPTPDGGMDLFSGKGSYHNTVTLNAGGLSGDGEIRYLTAISRAKQFSFFPDSVTGICYMVDIKGVTRNEISSTPNVHCEYPSVYSDSAMIYWMPEKDVFSALTKDTTLRIFDRKALFNGKIDLTPKNMLAQGELLYNNTGLFSDKFTLRNSTFDADSASLCNFDEKSPGDSTGHFYTDRFNAKYDLDAQYAQFVTTGDSSALVVFPQHKYRQKTDFFSCNLANNFYEFGNTLRNYDEKQITDDKEELGVLRMAYNGQGDKPVLTGVEMTSDKDTMVYNAISSSYKNDEAVINVHDPGVIEIVDSKIDPSGIITIRKNGLIDKFNNALITCKLDTLLHKIINTTVKIRDKYYYKAHGGQYEYKDEYKEISYLNIDSVEIRRIKADTAADAPKIRASFGIGSVPAQDRFMLSPQYMFTGKYSFLGNTPGIKFNGYAYIKQECDSAVMPFKFEGTLNSEHIVFPISDRVMDTAKVRLYTGFFYNEETSRVYSVFMGRKVNNRDFGVLAANKGLSYSISGSIYQIASSRRLADSTLTENYIALYKNLCDIYGEGEITPNINIKPLTLVMKGSMYHQRDINKVTLNSSMTLNLVVRQDAVKLMAEDIAETDGMKPLYLNKKSIQRKLQFLCGTDTLNAMMKDYTSTGEISKMPEALKKTFGFADVTFRYDTISNSYRSTGKIGVLNIGDKQINRYVSGYIEIIYNRKKGDQITVYLEPEKGKWYYFNYSAGFLYCFSSSDEFNDKINSTKEKDRIVKLKDSEYQYVIGNDASKNKFLRSFTSVVVDDQSKVEDRQNINNEQEADNNSENPENQENPENPENPENQENPQPEGDNNAPQEEEPDFEQEDETTPQSEEQPQPEEQSQPEEQPQPIEKEDDEPDFIDE